MKKVLPRTLSCLLAISLLLFSFTIYASGAGKYGTTHRALTVSPPPDLFVNTDINSNVATNVSLGTPVVTDDNAVVSVTNNAPASYPLGITTVTWTVTDNTGSTATATQNVTVTDNQKPFIYKMGEISVSNDPGQCGAKVKLFIPYAYDNSGGPVMVTNNAPAWFSVGSVTITWTATDVFGNSDTSTQVITVIDNELPTIAVTDIHVNNTPGQCGAAVDLGTPVTSDNCGVVSVTNDAPAFFQTGTTLVNWTVTDKTGYTNHATQTVVVTDIEKPVITAPDNVTVNNSAGKCGATAVALGTPVTSDNCGISGVSNNAPAVFPTGTTTVVWTVTDNSGNISTASQTVTVKDVQAPVFSNIPANTVASCDNIPAPATPTATDNCTAQPDITFSEISTRGTDATKTSYYNYSITRTWIAKDAAGNSSTAKQVITVADKTAPHITVPASINVANDLNTCGAIVKYTVTANDNCSSPVTLTYSKSSNSLFATGTTIVTVTAKDVSGNISSASFTVTVTDTQKPSVTAPANISLTVNNNNSTVSNLNIGTPQTSDNCGVKSITNNAPNTYAVGTTTVTWTVKDNSGNTSTAKQTITVTVSSTKKKSNEITEQPVSAVKDEVEEPLKIVVAPNPSNTYFTLKLESKYDTPVTLHVFDMNGRIIDVKSKLGANNTVQIGQNYVPGVYIADAVQGTRHTTVQLLKLR